jgi:NTP pyrophosphatase (non-canonical NTP hydrolase)
MCDKLWALGEDLTRKFPQSNEPFQIMTRLLEECGELAQEVNHWEGSDIKHQKHGAPDKAKLAHEVQHVLRCALQVAQLYEIEHELAASADGTYQRLKRDGFVG